MQTAVKLGFRLSASGGRIDHSKIRVVSGMDNHADAGSGGDRRAAQAHIIQLRRVHLSLIAPGFFLNRNGFARKRRYGKKKVLAFQKIQIARNDITRSDHLDIARYDILHRNLNRFPAVFLRTAHANRVVFQITQTFHVFIRAVILYETNHGAEAGQGEDDQTGDDIPFHDIGDGSQN